MGVVSIHDLKIYGYHGCLPEEAVIGTQYRIDVDVENDFTKAAKSDKLEHAVDYVEIAAIVKHEMAIRQNLIEVVVSRIVQAIRKRYPEAGKIKVKLYKLSPPVGIDLESVSVTLEG